MTAAILEIRDGIATGPLHQPVPVVGRNTAFDAEALDWPTLCGTEGYVYQRDALAALGYTTDCFDCAIAALSKPRKPRKPVAKVQAPVLPAPPRVCAGCGKLISRKSAKWCSVCYHGQRPKPGCGTRSRYVLGCRCELCTRAEADYAREYKRRRARRRAA